MNHYFNKKPALPWLMSIAFLLAGAAAAVALPDLSLKLGHEPTPTILQLSLSGSVLIFINALFLFLVSRFSKSGKLWLFAALISSSLVILMKFVLAPYSLYGQTIETGFLSVGFDPNEKSDMAAAGIGGAIFYIFALSIIYSIYKHKCRSKLLESGSRNKNIRTRIGSLLKSFSVSIAIFLLIALPTLIFAIFAKLNDNLANISTPLLVGIDLVFDYLDYSSDAVRGQLILLAIAAIALLFGIIVFKKIWQRSLDLKNAALLASFFWAAAGLVIAYHGLWIVYMITLAGIWHFKTVK